MSAIGTLKLSILLNCTYYNSNKMVGVRKDKFITKDFLSFFIIITILTKKKERHELKRPSIKSSLSDVQCIHAYINFLISNLQNSISANFFELLKYKMSKIHVIRIEE